MGFTRFSMVFMTFPRASPVCRSPPGRTPVVIAGAEALENDVPSPAGRGGMPGIDLGTHFKKVKISKFPTKISRFSDFWSPQVGLVGHPLLNRSHLGGLGGAKILEYGVSRAPGRGGMPGINVGTKFKKVKILKFSTQNLDFSDFGRLRSPQVDLVGHPVPRTV